MVKNILYFLIVALFWSVATSARASIGSYANRGLAEDTVLNSLPVLPYPQYVSGGSGVFQAFSSIEVKSAGLSAQQSRRLKEHLKTVSDETKQIKVKGTLHIELLLLSQVQNGQGAFWDKAKTYKDSIGTQGYILSAENSKVIISAQSETGLFYGLQTLKQLLRSNFSQQVFIADWPAYQVRVVFDDISRGPISKVDYIKKQIERLAEQKINYLSFYIEHVVKTVSHPGFAPENGNLTIAQIKELSAYAEKYHMKLIGSFQSFGHFEKILALDQYRSMGETPSLISPLDPKARQFLKDVIGELCEAFSAEWFNVNCDETFDLNKGKSKAYIDSIGADRFYADHLNFLYDVLKGHNKKMMMWGDVALQHERILDMLPKDVVYLSWEYGANNDYAKWIRPFASRGLEYMVCPGILNSYRMFPDMNMAKSNINGFLSEGKKSGATGAFTTLWDDGGAYLFSVDWYGVYYAAEKSWNLQKKNETSFDQRYTVVAYKSDNVNYVKAVNKLLQLRSLALTYNMNDLIWHQQILPKQSKQLWLNNQDVPAAQKILREASEFLSGSQASINLADITALQQTIAQYQILMDSRQLVASVGNNYKTASKIQQPDAAGSVRLLSESADSIGLLAGRYNALAANFEKLWLAENQPYWLDVVLQPYKSKATALIELEKSLRKLAGTQAQTALPLPGAIGADIVQTPHSYFQYWLLAGPFPTEKQGVVPDFMFSESKEYDKPPIPGAIAVYQNKNYRWKKFASDTGGPVELEDYFGGKSRAAAYAYCTLNVTGQQVSELFVKAAQGAEVFCDGEKVGVITLDQTDSGEMRIPLILKKGNHQILLKLPADDATPWNFSFRLGNTVQVVNSKHKYQTNSKNKTYEAE